jgi:hypothetical protein
MLHPCRVGRPPRARPEEAERTEEGGPSSRKVAGVLRQVVGQREGARHREGQQVRRAVEGDARQPGHPDHLAQGNLRGKEGTPTLRS